MQDFKAGRNALRANSLVIMTGKSARPHVIRSCIPVARLCFDDLPLSMHRHFPFCLIAEAGATETPPFAPFVLVAIHLALGFWRAYQTLLDLFLRLNQQFARSSDSVSDEAAAFAEMFRLSATSRGRGHSK